MALTPRQTEVLDLIATHIEEHGGSPTYEFIGGQLGIKSKSHVARIIGSLEKHGYIRRTPGMARSIEVLPREPDGLPLIDPETLVAAQLAADELGLTCRKFINMAIRKSIWPESTDTSPTKTETNA